MIIVLDPQPITRVGSNRSARKSRWVQRALHLRGVVNVDNELDHGGRESLGRETNTRLPRARGMASYPTHDADCVSSEVLEVDPRELSLESKWRFVEVGIRHRRVRV